MSIADNIARVRERMADAAYGAGRKDKVMLTAATKTRTALEIQEAIAAGVDACGENRVQEMMRKYSENAYDGAPLHYIGKLQRNKVKYTIGTAQLIESVDSVELMDEISRIAVVKGVVQDVLLEVNIGGESAKAGARPEDLECLLERAASLKGIRVRGLMAIPPAAERPGANRPYFRAMYKLYVDIRSKKYDNINIDILSMGMSDDFEDAIREGSSAVRIGSAIFGARE